MVFVHCHECSARVSLFDTDDKGWIESLDGKWLCPGKHNGAVGRASRTSTVVEEDLPEPGPLKGAQHHGLGRQEPQGFQEPEDGSEERYRFDRIRLPWSTHTFWWVVHNAVSHPLIAVLPIRPAFRFHDWTSRRMHGKR